MVLEPSASSQYWVQTSMRLESRGSILGPSNDRKRARHLLAGREASGQIDRSGQWAKRLHAVRNVRFDEAIAEQARRTSAGSSPSPRRPAFSAAICR